jgi:hypothetical protein
MTLRPISQCYEADVGADEISGIRDRPIAPTINYTTNSATVRRGDAFVLTPVTITGRQRVNGNCGNPPRGLVQSVQTTAM